MVVNAIMFYVKCDTNVQDFLPARTQTERIRWETVKKFTQPVQCSYMGYIQKQAKKYR